MENKKLKISLSTFLLLLAILVIIAMSYYIYIEKIKYNKEIAELEANATNSTTFTDEQVKTALSDFLELRAYANCDSLLERLKSKGKLKYNPSKDTILDDGKVITSIKFLDYKNAMLNYVSESEFEKNWHSTREFNENSEGYLTKVQGGGGLCEYTVDSISKKDDATYFAKTTVTFVDMDNSKENENYIFTVKSYGDKCVIDSIYEEVNEENEKNIVLYNGIEISTKTGVQYLDVIEINDKTNNKYNTTYYNYENGKYEGKTIGKFGEKIYYDEFSIVSNVKTIAMTQKYNAIPRNFTTIDELLEQLIEMADCSSVDIQAIDLDNDGKTEYIVCYTVNHKEGEIGDGEPEAFSKIMLLDDNYKKIANIVTLENGFWANVKEENYKIFLSINDVEYIDIDNDDIMEIIIEIPTYEGKEISILKYNKGNIEGEVNYKASVLP